MAEMAAEAQKAQQQGQIGTQLSTQFAILGTSFSLRRQHPSGGTDARGLEPLAMPEVREAVRSWLGKPGCLNFGRGTPQLSPV